MIVSERTLIQKSIKENDELLLSNKHINIYGIKL